MTYVHQDKVNPALAEKSKREIDAVNSWMNDLHGTVYAVKIRNYGQSRPYADHVIDALIYAYRPNVWTTNGPAPGWITKDDALALARMTFGEFSLKVGWNRYLETLSPHPDPCQEGEKNGDKYSCWHIVLRTPSTD